MAQFELKKAWQHQNKTMKCIEWKSACRTAVCCGFGFHMCKSSELGVAGACMCVYMYECSFHFKLLLIDAPNILWITHSSIHPFIHSLTHSFCFFFILSFFAFDHLFVGSHSFTFILNPNVDAVAVAAFDGFAIGNSAKHHKIHGMNVLFTHSTFRIPYHACVCVCVKLLSQRFFTHRFDITRGLVAEKSKLYVMPSLVR